MKKLLAIFLTLFLLAALPAQATITTTNSSTTLSANGVTTGWSFSFADNDTSDIEVIVTDSNGQQTTIPTTQYTVALNPLTTGQLWNIGGTVVYPLSGSPLASGNTITIQRIMPLQQTTDISNQGNFYPTVVEQALDTGVLQAQQISARTGQIRGTWVTDTDYMYGDMVVDGANGSDTSNIYMCANANTSGTWSTDLAAGDWVLALNVQGIVNSLPSIANNQVFGNITGSSAAPTGVGVSALIDSAIGSTQGDVLYRSGSAWSALAPGTSGQVLTSQGAAANPHWTSTAGSGTVTSVGTGTGLTGGPVTGSGTILFANVANQTLLGNVSGGSAAPSATTLSAFLDNILSSTQGSIIYRGGSLWSALGPGTSGQFLQTQGGSANPQWASFSSSANTYQALPGDPTGTTSTSLKMMGLAGSLTPASTGVVFFSICGVVVVSAANDGFTTVVKYGTGSAPANGDDVTGTSPANPLITTNSPGTNHYQPFCTQGRATGLSVSTAYWIDLALADTAGSGTASAKNLTVTAYEIK